MAITRKPKKNTQIADVDVDSLINRGGSTAQTIQTEINQKRLGEKQVALRIPYPMFDKIDKSLQQKTIRMPRHTWILEAIAEKLERESKESTS